MREDVQKFAELMSDVMDSKQVERETRQDPHYISDGYRLEQALMCVQDKAEQLYSYTKDAVSLEGNVNEFAKDRALKSAVHLANFAMIIYLKLKVGQSYWK